MKTTVGLPFMVQGPCLAWVMPVTKNMELGAHNKGHCAHALALPPATYSLLYSLFFIVTTFRRVEPKRSIDNGGRGSGTTMTERRLRVRTRSFLTGRRDPKSSLFARLSPRTARDLLDAVVADDDDDAPGNGWSVASCGSLDIEFLPIKVFFDSGDIIYTSYNGGSIADEGKRLHILSHCLYFRPEMSQFQNCHYHRTHTC
jgi:hypothetical protein